MTCIMSKNGPINKEKVTIFKIKRTGLKNGTVNERERERERSHANGLRKQLKDSYQANSGHI